MSHQFLKKKFSFTRLFLRFFGILIFSLSITVNVYAASPLTSLYENVINQPFPKAKTKVETKNTVVTFKTNIFTQLSTFLDKYYDSYTSGLALVLYPTASPDAFAQSLGPSLRGASPSQKPTGLAVVTTSSTLASLKTVVTSSSPQTKIVYIPGPQGPAGPQGPQGPKGDAGLTSFGSTITSSSPNPVAYMPVGITIPNPAQNFTGGEYASIANLTSNLFTNNTSNIITLNVSGNQTVTGNSSVGGTFNVTGATTLSGNLNVTGTITGSVTGAMNPALTNGSVFFQDTAGISQDNANFFYDKTNHRLGLGTVSPGAKLHVYTPQNTGNTMAMFGDGTYGFSLNQESGSGFQPGLKAISGGAGNSFVITSQIDSAQDSGSQAVVIINNQTTAFGSIATRPLFSVNNNGTSPGTSKFLITAAGNVGIGTTGPLAKLDVQGGFVRIGSGSITNGSAGDLAVSRESAPSSGAIYFGNNSNNYLYYTGSIFQLNTGGLQVLGGRTIGAPVNETYAFGAKYNSSTSGTFYFGATNSTTPDGVFSNNAGTERMRITDAGNVGIGTNNPVTKLVVGAAAVAAQNTVRIYGDVSANSAPVISLFRSGSRESVIAQILGSLVIANTTGLADYTDATLGAAAQLILTSTGNLGIGTTNPAQKLQVSGIAQADTAFYVGTGVGTEGGDDNLIRPSSSSAAFLNLKGVGGGAKITVGANLIDLVIGSGGTLNINNGAVGSTGAGSALAQFNTGLTLGSGYIGTNAPTGGAIIQGNVGIGTTGTFAPLQISATPSASVGLLHLRPSAGQKNYITFTENSVADQGAIGFDNGATTMNFYTGGVLNNGSVKMVIQSGGNVGIGTTGPALKTHIYGSAAAPSLSSNAGLLRLDTPLTVGMDFGVDSNSPNAPFIQARWMTGTGAYPLALNPLGGNVGIGTTGPGEKLDVSGNVAFGALTEKLSMGSQAIGFNRRIATGAIYDSNYYAYQFTHTQNVAPASDNLHLEVYTPGGSTVSSTAFSVNGNANVGIGNILPDYPLTVMRDKGISSGSQGILWAGRSLSSSAPGVIMGYQADGVNVTGAYLAAGGTGTGNDTLFFGAGSSQQIMTLKQGGNVGIGTTGPGALLHLYSSGVAGSRLDMQSADTGGRQWSIYSNGTANLGGAGGFQIYDATAATNRFFISAVGNVGIGTTSPGAVLDISSATKPQFIVRVPTTTNGGAGLQLVASSNGGGTRRTWGLNTDVNVGADLAIQVSATEGGALSNTVMSFLSTGNVGIGTTGPGALLDIRKTFSLPSAISSVNIAALSTDNQAQDKGGSIGLGGAISNAGGSPTLFGAMTGMKENGTNNNTAGYLAFFTNNVGLGERMRINSVGNVGIGYTDPQAIFHIRSPNAELVRLEGNTSNTSVNIHFMGYDSSPTMRDGYLRFIPVSGTNQSRYSFSNSSSASEIFSIREDGNVGIGTTGPGATLDVVGNGTSVYQLQLKDTGAGTKTLKVAVDPNNTYFDLTNNLLFRQSGVEKMRLDTNGNVGIGTTVPAGKFEVSASAADASIYTTTYGAGQINGVVGRIARGTSASPAAAQQYDRLLSLSGTGYYTSGGTGFSNPLSGLAITQEAYETYTSTAQGNRLVFYTTANGSTTAISRLIIGQDGNLDVVTGNLGIGLPGAPAQKLDVNGTIRQTGGTNCALSANASGDIICTSDANLKQNMSAFSNGLSVINAISPSYFQYKNESYTHIGFIAQNVQTVLPEATPLQNNGYLGLDTNAILAATVNAIKELDLKITDLADLNNLTKANPLRDALVAWFGNVGNGVGDVFANVFNAKEKICVDGECLTKEDIRSLLLIAHPSGSSGSVVNNGGGNTPPPTPDPVCTSPQTLVNGVCVDPAPETPPSDTLPAETP